MNNHINFLDEPLYGGEICDMVLIENKRGLHARAAAKFVRVVESFKAEVFVVHEDMRVSGRSIMGLMMLAATSGTQLKLCIAGEDALAAMESIKELVKRKFDES